MNSSLLWLSFLVCTLAIFFSGTKLSRYGDIIAEKSGLGKLWIGVILLAFVTSLPELVTGISSVVIFSTPDIAVGDVLGSCVFNMVILALLDIFHRATPISSRVQQGHTLSAGFGILLLSIITVNIFLSSLQIEVFNIFGSVGPYTPIIIILYIIAMRLIFSYERRSIAAFFKETAKELRYEHISKKQVYVHFTLNAVIVVIAAIFLPEIGIRIAEITQLGQTFVGNIFIAFSTSLPEVVVSIAAVRIGSSDLAIGNLFGSSIFNIAILAIDDIFFLKGPLLSFVENAHMVSSISAVIMMTIAIIGLTYRASKKRLFLAWDALSIVGVYVLNLTALYLLRQI
jgi:cation:H+ antiporter